MSSKEEEELPKSLFLFILQAYEDKMMGPSKLIIGHQCHTHTPIISSSSSQLNSYADLIIYVVNFQVLAKTIAITYFLGRNLETLKFEAIKIYFMMSMS